MATVFWVAIAAIIAMALGTVFSIFVMMKAK